MKLYQLISFALLTVLIYGCKDDAQDITPPTVTEYLIQFEITEVAIKERDATDVVLTLEEPLKNTDTIYIKIKNNTTIFNDYKTDRESDIIKIHGISGLSSLTFTIQATYDSKHENIENFALEIIDVPAGYKIGPSAQLSCNIVNNDYGDGLVGEYLFSNNSKDSSPDYNNDGTVFGAALTSDRKGNLNSAYNFDGVNDYISIPDNNATDFATDQDFSISLWVSVSFPQAEPTNTIFDILRKWSGDTQGYPFSISFVNEYAAVQNKFLTVRYDGSGCTNSLTQYSSVIDSDAWHHIVMIKQGSTIYQYLDNVKVAEDTDNTVCETANNSHITVGCRGQLVRFFKGKIDDIKFYNRAVTVDDIQTLFEE